MTTFVGIRHKTTGAEGTSPIRALPHWESLGYEALDKDEVAAARKTDGVTVDDVQKVADSAPFNPADHSPAEVKTYLASVADDQTEHDRVVEAEKAGKNRSTALA
jgi:hypothetical protein